MDPQVQLNVETLSKEYERVSSDIRGIETGNDKVVGFGLTIVGAGFAYGIQQNIIEMFFFLPIGLIGVLSYAMLQYHNMFWYGGYKRAIEDKVNDLSGTTVLCWEALIARRRGRIHTINVTMASIYFMAFFGITLYSLFKIFNSQTPVLAFLYLAVIAELAVLLAYSIRQLSSAYEQAYCASRQLFSLSESEASD